jgi:hypothetical protein
MYVSGEVYFNTPREIETSFDWRAYYRKFFKHHHELTLSLAVYHECNALPHPEQKARTGSLRGFERIIGAILFRQHPDVIQHAQMDAMNNGI